MIRYAEDEQVQLFLEDLKRMLFQGITTVTFTKVDGSERVMKCTLNEDYLPVPEQPEEDAAPKPKRNLSPDVCRVWDIENKGWRSFRYDSVTRYEWE